MAKINILAVDDDLVNLKLIEVMLKKNSNIGEIVKANNGLEALDILDRRTDINLILLDIVMPVMNGLEFLDNMQMKENLSSIPVIVLTTDETAKREAFNKGAYDFITKPVFEKDLNQKINDAANLIS